MNPGASSPLDAGDRQSAAWLKLKKFYQERLESLRKRNDNAKLNAEQTAQLRGQIAEAKYILSLGEDKPIVEPEKGLNII